MKVIRYVWIIILFVFLIFIVFYKFRFLRQPLRNVVWDNTKITSPANGKIVQILEWDQEKIPVIKKHKNAFDLFTSDVGTSGYLISIMMTPLDVHYQKASTDAVLINQIHTSWKFLNAIKLDQIDNIVFENERNEMLWETKDWIKYKIIQIAGKLARRIVPMKDIWDEVNQWDVIWLIKFGSQVTVVLPKDRISVVTKVWDIVVDGETILAEIR